MWWEAILVWVPKDQAPPWSAHKSKVNTAARRYASLQVWE